MKSMKQINEQKWSRMRKIIEALKQKPLTFDEITSLFTTKKDKTLERSIQNYLAELKALGLVSYDAGMYVWSENKLVYNSELEYKNAVKHSKKLVAEFEPDIEDIPIHDVNHILDLLICTPENHTFFVQHLQTGYRKSFWNTFEEFQQLLSKHGFDVHCVSTSFIPVGFDADSEPQIPKKDMEKLSQLKEKLLKELFFIINQVSHEVPLKGYCDLCLGKHVEIIKKKRRLS